MLETTEASPRSSHHTTKGGRVCSDYTMRVWRIMVGKVRQEVCEAPGHIASAARKQRERNAGTHGFLLFIRSRTPPQRGLPPTFRVHLLTSINSTLEFPSRHAQRSVSMVIRNPIKSTVKVTPYTAPELQSHHKIDLNVGRNDTVYLDFFLSLFLLMAWSLNLCSRHCTR